MKDIYPSYAFIFVIFNLLGLWFKDKIFYSWIWVILIIIIELIFNLIMIKITKHILKEKKESQYY